MNYEIDNFISGEAKINPAFGRIIDKNKGLLFISSSAIADNLIDININDGGRNGYGYQLDAGDCERLANAFKELSHELQKIKNKRSVVLKGRDHKTKEALIEYLQYDTDERFWQAIANFGCKHGLCGYYLVSSYRPPRNDGFNKDLFFQESDSIFNRKENK